MVSEFNKSEFNEADCLFCRGSIIEDMMAQRTESMMALTCRNTIFDLWIKQFELKYRIMYGKGRQESIVMEQG